MNPSRLDLPERLPGDRALIIQRSIRCFIFGMIGLVPVLGLSMASLSFRLRRQVAADTGEPLSLIPLHAVSLCALAVAGSCLLAESLDGALTVMLMALGAGIVLLWRQYWKRMPVEWNPARHLLYWGTAFAYIGCVLSFTLLIFGSYLAMKN